MALNRDKILQYLPLRKLDRYLMRQFWIAYAICSSSLIGLFMVLEGLGKLKKFVEHDNLIAVVFHYFVASVPIYFSQYMGPVLTLIAAMFATTMLNKGRELIPMKASGISVPRILAPLFLVAFILALVQIGVQEVVLPNLKETIRVGLSYGKRREYIRPDTVRDRREPNEQLLIAAEQYYPVRKKAYKVKVTELGESGYKSIILADDMTWSSEGYWILNGWRVNEWNQNNDLVRSEGQEESSEGIVLHTSIQPIDLESTDSEIPYLSYRELLSQYHRRNLKHLEVKLHQRFSFPLANMILLLLGLPFVLRGHQKSVIFGVAVAIAIAGAYMFCSAVCADLGNKGVLTPAVAAWVPVLFFGALGFTIFDGVET